MAFVRDLLQRPQSQIMTLDILAALLIGGEGQSRGAFKRRPRILNFERQAFQQLGAEGAAVAPLLQATGDQLLENFLQLRRRKNLADASRR